MRETAFDAKKVLHVEANPEIEHICHPSVEAFVKQLLDREVEDRGF
jgi:hypothetical protein